MIKPPLGMFQMVIGRKWLNTKGLSVCSQCVMCDEHNWTFSVFIELWGYYQWKRLTFYSKQTSPWFSFLLPSVFLSSSWPCLPFSNVSVHYALSCLPHLPLSPLSPPFPSFYMKGRFRGHQLLREAWESCMGSALGAAMLHYRQGDCRYAAATGCRHNNHRFSPSTGPYRLS